MCFSGVGDFFGESTFSEIFSDSSYDNFSAKMFFSSSRSDFSVSKRSIFDN